MADLQHLDVTELLGRASSGDSVAFDDLIDRIYSELRTIASGQRRRLGASATVNTTAVVHEAYEKMARSIGARERAAYVDRGHFFRVASHVMRDIVVDYARSQTATKRGGRNRSLSIDDVGPNHLVAAELDIDEILSVNSALDRLNELDTDAAQVAELRYFAGLTIDQAAEAVGVSTATIKRRWTIARTWLYRELAA